MIKVRLQDDEVIEVSGDEKEVSKFIKKYMDYMDEEFLLPSGEFDDDEDDDEEEEHHFKVDPYAGGEVWSKLTKIAEKLTDSANEKIVKLSNTDKDNKDDNLSSYSKYVDSSDYKERFKAEYNQLRIRVNKLGEMLDKWDQGKLNFTPKTPKTIFVSQYNHMVEYLEILKVRACIEDIDV